VRALKKKAIDIYKCVYLRGPWKCEGRSRSTTSLIKVVMFFMFYLSRSDHRRKSPDFLEDLGQMGLIRVVDILLNGF